MKYISKLLISLSVGVEDSFHLSSGFWVLRGWADDYTIHVQAGFPEQSGYLFQAECQMDLSSASGIVSPANCELPDTILRPPEPILIPLRIRNVKRPPDFGLVMLTAFRER